MTDIDFDELDKAVSSVMQQTKPGESPRQGSSDSVVEALSSDILPPVESTVDSNDDMQQSSETMPETDTSEGVTTTDSISQLETPEITPAADVSQLETQAEEVAALSTEDPEASADTSSEQDAAASVISPISVQPVKRSGRFMDVVHPSSDMGVSKTTSAPTPREGATIAPLSSLSAQMTDSTVVDEQANAISSPSQDIAEPASPFLPDASSKVEKRPLGPMPVATTTEPNLMTSPEASSPEGEGDAGAPAAVPLPDELKSDVVSLESSEHALVTPGAAVQTDESTMMGVESQEETPVLATPQQTEAETEHAAAFTTESHAPLMHPKKKRSGLKIIIIVVLLVLLGAGGGLGLYLAGMI